MRRLVVLTVAGMIGAFSGAAVATHLTRPAAISQTRSLYLCVRADGSTTPVLAYTPSHRGGVQCVRWKVDPVP